MINRQDLEKITSLAGQFNVSEVYIFGSSLQEVEENHDIDIAVKGIEPSLFFDFYGKLLRSLSKPVDLVDLSLPDSFTKYIEQSAVKIYG